MGCCSWFLWGALGCRESRVEALDLRVLGIVQVGVSVCGRQGLESSRSGSCIVEWASGAAMGRGLGASSLIRLARWSLCTTLKSED